ncbi:DUF1510 family protein [Gottfriedia acidiceleris]
MVFSEDKSNQGGSVGTVSAKAKGSQKYRVYLQWDRGWLRLYCNKS